MIFILIAVMFISMIAQFYVQSNYAKYSKITILSDYTGAQVAQKILHDKGIYDVTITQSKGGVLSDHYDPRKKTVALSPDIYNQATIAAAAVAAHEVGHAIQHNQNYSFLVLRNRILPVAVISSNLAYILIFIGIIGSDIFFQVGIIMMSVIALFQLVTLPVEFDASKRALQILSSDRILDGGEVAASKKMLNAAALTYVAALLSTLLTILYYVSLFNRRRN